MATTIRRVLEAGPGRYIEREMHVVREAPLTVRFNGRELVTLLCDGENPRELACGFLFNEGLIERETPLDRIAIDETGGVAEIDAQVDDGLMAAAQGKRVVTSGCGKGSVFYQTLDTIKARHVRVEGRLRLPVSFLIEQGRLFVRYSETHDATHGTHGAALVDRSGIICFREDIGRHNALDKLAGWLLEHPRDPSTLALYTTGRITCEVVLKAVRFGTPLVVSRARPTELALQLAEQVGLSVVCAVRDDSCLVVLGPERIDLNG